MRITKRIILAVVLFSAVTMQLANASADSANAQSMLKYRCTTSIQFANLSHLTLLTINAKDAETAVSLSQMLIGTEWLKRSDNKVFESTVDLTFAKSECSLVP